MKPGRELDALIHEKVMGIKICQRHLPEFYWLPYYSTDIAAAWEVVEKLRELNEGDVFEFRLTWQGKKDDKKYVFRIWESDLPLVDLESFDGDTAPHAICLAALKAVE